MDITSPTNVTVGGPHTSLAVNEPGFGGGTVALQARVTFAGQVINGGVVSTVLVICCVHVAVFPH